MRNNGFFTNFNAAQPRENEEDYKVFVAHMREVLNNNRKIEEWRREVQPAPVEIQNNGAENPLKP